MRTAALVTTLLLAACAPLAPPPQTSASGAPEIQLLAERTSATTVKLTLRNGSPNTIGYNLCASGLERRDGGTWRSVPTQIVCTMELRTLAPGGSATSTREIPIGLAPGDYRLVTNVEAPLGTAQVGLTSEAFTID